ncbi:MAG: VWA domain-containing protein [Nitrospirae bacterium]|nr:MAG: VWA domain-containing protein [Nitrospirota bacterium]
MSADSIVNKVTAFLEADLERMAAAELAGRLVGIGHAAAALELLTELREASRKVASVAVEALPEVVALLPGEAVATWIDLAISLNEQSGAASIKFCKESPAILRAMETVVAGPALSMALELAEQDANVALEGFRQASGVAAAAGVVALPLWAQIGADLAKLDYVLGIEYLRRGPEILKVLAQEDLKAWASVSLKLVTPNSLGKPDYMAALAFFRTSPALLGDLATPAVRRLVLALGGVLADHSPEQAIEFLGEAPGWLRRIRDPQWQERVLQYGTLIAERDAAAAMAYLRRAPEVIDLADPDAPAPSPALVGAGGAPRVPVAPSNATGDGPPLAMIDRFDKWYRGGMEVLAYNPDAARAYFAVETRKALDALEEAASGVALRSVARVLKLFAEGLSGHPVTIRPLEEGEAPIRSKASADGSTIFLPARMRRYPTKEDNLRVYKVLTAHEAGHLEYGTYDLHLNRLADLAAQAGVRYGRAAASALASLEDLFQLYPHPLLIRDLWMMAEDARIEACLKAEYPGLRRDMAAVAREEVARRSLTHGMSVRELVVELLLQMSAGDPDEVRVPDALADVVERAWALLQAVATPHATAEDVVRAVHRAYVLIEELTAKDLPTPPDGAPEDLDQPREPRVGEEQGGAYRPVIPFIHHGVMDAARVREPEGGVGDQAAEPSALALEGAHGEPSLSLPTPVEGRSSSSLADDARVVSEEGTGAASAALPGLRAFFYDEWDGRIQDYRTRWCRVVEQAAPEGTEDFIGLVRSRYGGVLSLIRRYFEGIRPPALRQMRRQADGEEVDIEAAVEALVERKAHVSASEGVYIRRDRRDRDVAAAFLVDLSGSTGQQIGPGGARIIDVEKEGLVLLCEALEAIGDQYAVYGYSGQSRHDVQVLVLKDFDERYGPQVWRRIDAVGPLVQNRDGAAIRHALHRLSERAAKVKLLVVLSDGRPLDDAYQEEYALEDTKAALREAKALGVHPFCITVDREARGYLARLYGEVCYLIIDRAESLPERLPRIYRTLTT